MKKEMDFSRAFGRADRDFVRMVESTVEEMKNREERKMKRKLPALVIAVAVMIILATGTALALSAGWGHIEQAMDLAVENGDYEHWSLEAKMKLMEAMRKDGISISETDWSKLTGSVLTEKEKHALADRILTGYYGDQEFLYYFTIADAEWGEQRSWTLEQKHWFWNTLREKGLFGDDYWIDLLPEDGDMTPSQAVEIAKGAIREAYGLADADLAAYKTDVSFFRTADHETPRWQVEFYQGEAADYAVLITREGEVTEDEDLGVLTPAHAKQRKEEREQAAPEDDWTRRGKEKLQDVDRVFYNPAGGTYYHFLRDCPLVSQKYLPLTELDKTDPFFGFLSSCPCCVNDQVFWSAEDKIRYHYGAWQMPGADWISQEEAKQIAERALEEQGIKLENMRPAVYTSGEHDDRQGLYIVYFGTVSLDGDGQCAFDFRYAVRIDGKTGQVIYAGKAGGNG